MKQFLIIPLGGQGLRFAKAGYKTYKSFLNISKNTTILDNIAKNFDQNVQIIILANEKKFSFIKKNFKRKKTIFLKIKNHKLGPLYSIFLAKEKLKKIIKNDSFFITYSDINWNWNYKNITKYVNNKKAVVFSHTDFHPDLEVDNRADFFLCNKNDILNEVSEKKPILKDYKKNMLAIGCYYFDQFKYFEKYFDKKIFFQTSHKKEYYIINLLDFLLKQGLIMNHYELNNFVHLGIPSQYENFLKWKEILTINFNKSLKLNYPKFMLMAGKGKRVKNLKEKKPFLKIKKEEIYKFIFNKFGFKNSSIITNKNYFNKLSSKYKIFKIKETNSMLQTIKESLIFLNNQKNFFLLSCDCFGTLQSNIFKKFISANKPDVVLFAFSISKLQRKLSNSHTTIKINSSNKITSINVKNFSKDLKEFGHAGFFWIKDSSVFKYLNEYIKKSKLGRELLLDDYFKYLFEKRLFKVKCFKLDKYVHIGSVKEYKELKYWERFFKNEHK